MDRQWVAAPVQGAETLLAMLSPYLAEAVCVYDRRGVMTARLAAPEGLLGYGDHVGRNIFEYAHPDDLPITMEVAVAIVESEPGWQGCWAGRLRHRDGSWRLYEFRVFNRLDDPDVAGVVVCVREAPLTGQTIPMTQTLDLGLDLEQAVESLVDAIPAAIVVLDAEGVVRHVNQAALELTGRPERTFVGITLASLAAGEDGAAITDAIGELRHSGGLRIIDFQTADGKRLQARVQAHGRPGRVSTMTAFLDNVTDQYLVKAELERRATTDPLTGLANRTQVLAVLDGFIAEDPSEVAVLFLDLDGFKEINDELGHAAGDEALVQIAAQLRVMARPEDVVGRIGGDEFVVVCPRAHRELADDLVCRYRDLEVIIDGWSRPVRASVGLAQAAPGESPAALLDRADHAMYENKRQH